MLCEVVAKYLAQPVDCDQNYKSIDEREHDRRDGELMGGAVLL